jgi:hypothetical protein
VLELEFGVESFSIRRRFALAHSLDLRIGEILDAQNVAGAGGAFDGGVLWIGLIGHRA